MRRFTFSVMLALATVAVNAQEVGDNGWETDLSTTEKTADLQRGGAMAIDNEGNSIVTGSFDKELWFGQSYLEPIATSAFIAKYDKGGTEQWAASLQGAATVTTVTTDAEGNVYAAGVFADVVKIIDSESCSVTINGMEGQTEQVSGFIVKFDKNGICQAHKVVIPEVTHSGAFYWEPDPGFTPIKLIVNGNKLLMAVSAKADNKIDDLEFNGQYVNKPEDYVDQDVATLGIISLSTNLTEATLVAQLAATQKQTSFGYGAEDVNFATDGSKVYAGFVAYGNDLTLKSANGSKQITDLLNQSEGEETQYEHAFIVATIENGKITNTQIYHSQIDEKLGSAKFNTIDEMAYNNGNLYLAGTFNETFPFDNSKSYVGGCDTYLASLKASDLTKNWALTSGYDEGDAMHNAEVVTAMAVFDDEVQLAGCTEATNGHKIDKCLNFFVDTDATPTAMETKAGDEASFITSAAQNGIYTIMQSDNKDEEGATEGRYTYEFNYDIDAPTGIKQIAATTDNTINFDGNTVTLTKAADIDLYTVSGALVKSAKNVSSLSLDNVASGMYLLKAGKQTVKIVK